MNYIAINAAQQTGLPHIEIAGKPVPVPAGAIAYVFADPNHGFRWIYNREEARDVHYSQIVYLLGNK